MYDRFLKLMTLKGVTPAIVARDAKVDPSCLSQWKHGAYTPKPDKIQKIAKYFGVSVEYFYGEDEGQDVPLKSILSADEMELIEGFRSASPETRDHMLYMARSAILAKRGDMASSEPSEATNE